MTPSPSYAVDERATRVEQREVLARARRDGPLAVLGLGEQVEGDEPGSASPEATTKTSLGPRKPSMPTSPETSRLASWT
jgi:hypothetical protein